MQYSFTQDQIVRPCEPQSSSPVLLIVGVLSDNFDADSGQLLNLKKGDIYITQYAAVEQFVLRGEVELV